ncbi:hypothetical protein RRG08_027009 [Elysia crispata]|uniref:Uncharacterized protein n=1 Tax=Elysia crispata TaxID=231223 RepID=A0AAE1AIT1_9GAST|nr:hypothetical protein RRG08_027009 [Elysia crispata]
MLRSPMGFAASSHSLVTTVCFRAHSSVNMKYRQKLRSLLLLPGLTVSGEREHHLQVLHFLILPQEVCLRPWVESYKQEEKDEGDEKK